MSSTPEQFLAFSVSAHSTAGGSEFNYRNAASRAYYAAFIVAMRNDGDVLI